MVEVLFHRGAAGPAGNSTRTVTFLNDTMPVRPAGTFTELSKAHADLANMHARVLRLSAGNCAIRKQLGIFAAGVADGSIAISDYFGAFALGSAAAYGIDYGARGIVLEDVGVMLEEDALPGEAERVQRELQQEQYSPFDRVTLGLAGGETLMSHGGVDEIFLTAELMLGDWLQIHRWYGDDGRFMRATSLRTMEVMLGSVQRAVGLSAADEIVFVPDYRIASDADVNAMRSGSEHPVILSPHREVVVPDAPDAFTPAWVAMQHDVLFHGASFALTPLVERAPLIAFGKALECEALECDNPKLQERAYSIYDFVFIQHHGADDFCGFTCQSFEFGLALGLWEVFRHEQPAQLEVHVNAWEPRFRRAVAAGMKMLPSAAESQRQGQLAEGIFDAWKAGQLRDAIEPMVKRQFRRFPA